MITVKLKSSHKGASMSSTNYRTPRPIAGMKRNNRHSSPFDDLALEYDAWFDRGGSLIFFTEVKAFRELLLILL